MAILSSAVNPGDDILAAAYNNLRTDLLTGDVTIAGVKTFSGIPVFNAGITLSDDSSIAATKKFYLDGPGGHTYFTEGVDNRVDLLANGATMWSVGAAGFAFGSFDVLMNATKALILDADTSSHTKIVESSNDVVDHYVGSSIMMRMDGNGIAPGDNESMMWDVVIFSVDGTSPDSVGYAIDEGKVYGGMSVGHSTATRVDCTTDTADQQFTDFRIDADTIYIAYGAQIGAGEAVQVTIFYIA